MCVCGTLCALKFDQLTSQQQGGSPPPLTFQVRKDLLEYLWFPSVRPQQKFQPTEIHYKSLNHHVRPIKSYIFWKLMTPTNTLTLRDDKDKQWQIHKYTNKNCLKDPSCAIYLFKDIKYDIPCNMVDMGMVDMDMDEDNDNEDNDNEDNDNEDKNN